MTGHVFTRELDQATIASSLPLQASDVPLRVLISSSYTEKQLAYARRQYGVRRARVRELIEWAIANNPHFAHISLNLPALQELPEDGVDARIVQDGVGMAPVAHSAHASAAKHGTGLEALTRMVAEPGTEESIQYVMGIQLTARDAGTHYQNAAQAIGALASDATSSTYQESKYVSRTSAESRL
jgi:hypothetical protein